MLALAMAVSPALAMAGEMHQFEHASEVAADHHVSYEHGHPDQLPDGDPNGDPNGDPGGDPAGDALHVLAHASHCCAQAVAVLTATAVLQLMDQAANAVSSPPPIRHQRVAFNHFRPPIAV